MHLRNVVDFLFIQGPQPTDVVAADYCTPGKWEAVRPAISATLERARTRANKELAHLTTERKPDASLDKVWDAEALTAEVAPILKLFVMHAKVDGVVSEDCEARAISGYEFQAA